ncbi:MAG: riboflavin synthase [Spirochaetaceae bacterium]
MFTGIIEEVGAVLSISGSRNSKKLQIRAKVVLENTVLGDSISINGVCQTVVAIDTNSFTVNILQESLNKTNLNKLKPFKKVNLERALTMNKPFGGHFVQGHVQETGVIKNIRKVNKNTFLSIKISPELNNYMVNEGSVTVDGLSLTIAEIRQLVIIINIIPHTLANTTVNLLKVGDLVNIEPDILVKTVVEKQTVGLTKEKLLGWGY